MNLAEGVKLEICRLLHHLWDGQLRHRVESIVSFSTDYLGDIQNDQLRRYVELKQSDLPTAIAAKKSREFRCPPREQMNAILGFKNLEEEDKENCQIPEDLTVPLTDFHDEFISKLLSKTVDEELVSEENVKEESKPGLVNRMMNVITLVKKAEEEAPSEERVKTPEEIFRQVLITTIVRWAQETVSPFYYKHGGANIQILKLIPLVSPVVRNSHAESIELKRKTLNVKVFENYNLVREMFRLLLRQYDGVGEVIRALAKTYVINSRTAKDVQAMWVGLSRVRGLLPVQMSQEEEELMRELLWKMVNNHVFFQHPDLIRILRTHENVMAIMMNTLGMNAFPSLRLPPNQLQMIYDSIHDYLSILKNPESTIVIKLL